MSKILPYIKHFFKRADMVLLTLCVISSFFGLVVIYSATLSYDTAQYVIIQFGAIILGIGLFVLFTIIDIDIFADKWIILFSFCVLLLVILQIFGVDDNTGNKAWLRFLGIGIQPSEIIKVIFIILLAKQASYLKEFNRLSSPFSVIQLVAHFLFFFGMLIVISGDLGSALVYLFIFIVILYASGLKLYWFAIGVAAVAAVTPLLWTYVLKDYQKERILAPYVSSIDPTNTGVNWQPFKSKLALASGQLTGTGLGNGTQAQSSAFPAKETDFIFGVIGEELGMLGCLAVLVLLISIIVRCVYVGIKSRNTMNMLVCFGVAATIGFQTFENIGMCIGIAPVIGITLPFFSSGGSSVVSLFAAMGIVSGIKYRPKPERFRRYG